MDAIAVTGGGGFIGANVARQLLDSGVSVRVIDDFSTGNVENLSGLDVSCVTGSILDPKALDEALSGCSSVIHLAARPSVARSVDNPMASHESNATGTMQVLEAARRLGVRHAVVASSSSVYGANPKLPKSEDDVTRPMSPYAASKLATEAYALAYQASFGLPVLVFRFFNVYGPLQPAGHAYAACIPAFITAALRGDPITINGDGKQTRDFTFVDTVAEVICSAALRRITSDQPVNLAFGGSTDLLSLVSEIEEAVGVLIEREHLDPRPGDVRHSQADPTRLKELFPEVQEVDLADGIRKTVEWWRKKL